MARRRCIYGYACSCPVDAGTDRTQHLPLCGQQEAGIQGSLFSGLGIILPSFLVILLIAFFFTQFKDNPIVERIFKGIRPAGGGTDSGTIAGVKIGRNHGEKALDSVSGSSCGMARRPLSRLCGAGSHSSWNSAVRISQTKNEGVTDGTV